MMNDFDEEIILQATNVERYQINDKYTEIKEMYLTSQNLLLSYEKYNGFFSKNEDTMEKIPLMDIKTQNGKAQVKKVDDNDYGMGLQIIYKNNTHDHFVFEDEKEISIWLNAINKVLIDAEDNAKSSKEKNNNNKSPKSSIRKCPNCGATISHYEHECSYCGTEFKNFESSNILKEFSNGLEKIISKELPKYHSKESFLKKTIGRDFKSGSEKEEFEIEIEEKHKKEIANYIKCYPIPSSKEELLEFMLLVTSNIDLKNTDDIEQEAWINKMNQIYKKAKIIITNPDDLKDIEDIYNKKTKEIKFRKVYTILTVLGTFVISMLLMVALINFYYAIGILLIVLAIGLFIFYKMRGQDIKLLQNREKLVYIFLIVLIIGAFILIFAGHNYSRNKTYDKNYDNYYNETIKKNDVEIIIDFQENILFNRYDVELSAYDQKVVISHGEDKTVNFKLPDGIHKLSFKNLDDDTIDTINLVVKGNTKVTYKISCHTDETKITEMAVEYLDENKDNTADSENKEVEEPKEDNTITEEELEGQNKDIVIMLVLPEEYVNEDYKDVEKEMRDLGFTNIVLEAKETEDVNKQNGMVADLTIDGGHYDRGEKFNKNVEVKITYWELKTIKLDKIVLPKEGSKLAKDYDNTSNAKTKCYLNVDGVKNIPKTQKYENAIVTDGVYEYLEDLKKSGYKVEITKVENKNVYAGFNMYDTYFKVASDAISWTMFLSIQDEKYVEYEFDIYMQ